MLRLTAAALLLAAGCAGQEYTLGPDSQPHDGVPKGTVTRHTWNTSKIFPGTTRDYWVYVPAQYDGSKPACVMVFQDGAGFQGERGAWRAPIVLDNLIHQNAIPVTIAIFIDPGVLPAASDQQQARYNRSYEYDGLGPRYARFLIEEILPEVAKGYKLSSDPNDRAIAGSSSGGIAAFTAAWERPDAFRRVMSFVGSYTNLRGGDMYAAMVRKMEPKPLRVFLQDGTNDQNIYSGSWYQANQELAKSLEYAGYDSTFVVGTEAHNSKHGAAILPEAMRWLWRGHPAPIAPAKTTNSVRHYVREILDPDYDWEEVASGLTYADGPAVDKEGNLYFCDSDKSRIYRLGADGKPVVFKEDTGGARSLMFAADGTLYAAQRAARRVVAYRPNGAVDVLATGQEPMDLAVTSRGVVYFSDGDGARIWTIGADRKPRMIGSGDMVAPNGVRLSPDEALLAVADHVGRSAWSYRIDASGGISDGQPFYHLELPDEPSGGGPLRPGADAVAFDTTGHVYISTSIGIQVCDQPGRVVGIIRKPSPERVTGLVFGGPGMQTLYATSVGKVWRRKLRRSGYLPWQPVKPPRPQL